jgi:hypothetical protein
MAPAQRQKWSATTNGRWPSGRGHRRCPLPAGRWKAVVVLKGTCAVQTLFRPCRPIMLLNKGRNVSCNNLGVDLWPEIQRNRTGSWAYQGGQTRMPDRAKSRSMWRVSLLSGSEPSTATGSAHWHIPSNGASNGRGAAAWVPTRQIKTNRSRGLHQSRSRTVQPVGWSGRLVGECAHEIARLVPGVIIPPGTRGSRPLLIGRAGTQLCGGIRCPLQSQRRSGNGRADLTGSGRYSGDVGMHKTADVCCPMCYSEGIPLAVMQR